MTVRHDVAEGVATITIDRPAVRNAFTVEMFDDFQGAGDAFSAGLDLVAAAGQAEMLERIIFDFDPQSAPIVALQQIDTPVIAAINGPAAGYAVGIAIGADIRVMARGAKLVPATKRNLVPESGDTWLLPRLVGWEQAARFFFLGEELSGEAALEAGVVSELAEDAEATRARAAELAAQVAAMPPLAVRAAKRVMRAGRAEGYVEHVDRVLRELVPLFRTKDFGEAVAAFMDKRPPTFTGE
jgi:enoyl-CoA hydratase/carnithine racemase